MEWLCEKPELYVFMGLTCLVISFIIGHIRGSHKIWRIVEQSLPTDPATTHQETRLFVQRLLARARWEGINVDP